MYVQRFSHEFVCAIGFSSLSGMKHLSVEVYIHTYSYIILYK